MKLLHHTDEHMPTFIDDVFQFLIGKHVTIFTISPTPISGTVEESNGYMVHLKTTAPTKHIYVFYDKISAIVGDE
jgi:hypothetical protein